MIGGEVAALAQVVGIDVLLAGDNAIAIGALAATVAPALRARALMIGVALALVIRVAAALGVSWLLAFPGVMIIGGAVLVVVAIRLAVDILVQPGDAGSVAAAAAPRTFTSAILAIAANRSRLPSCSTIYATQRRWRPRRAIRLRW